MTIDPVSVQSSPVRRLCRERYRKFMTCYGHSLSFHLQNDYGHIFLLPPWNPLMEMYMAMLILNVAFSAVDVFI